MPVCYLRIIVNGSMIAKRYGVSGTCLLLWVEDVVRSCPIGAEAAFLEFAEQCCVIDRQRLGCLGSFPSLAFKTCLMWSRSIFSGMQKRRDLPSSVHSDQGEERDTTSSLSSGRAAILSNFASLMDLPSDRFA
jgi:hypothetical protein